MCKLHLIILEYIGVHGFVDLLNRNFPLDSVLGPPGKILLFLPHTGNPWKFWPLDHPPPMEFPVTLHGGGEGGGMDILWNHTMHICSV